MTARRGWPSFLVHLIPLGSVLLVMVILPFSFFVVAFWAAEGSWDFEGRSGWRYWVFLKGSRLDRLGLVSPAPAPPPRFSVRFQEGTFPGWKVLSYPSTEMPETILAAYAKRCGELGLKITSGPKPDAHEGDEAGASLVCEIRPYLDAEFYAGRKPGAVSTQVGVRVWGSD
jgi:hypothetical protein